jgi:hypothetical protein
MKKIVRNSCITNPTTTAPGTQRESKKFSNGIQTVNLESHVGDNVTVSQLSKMPFPNWTNQGQTLSSLLFLFIIYAGRTRKLVEESYRDLMAFLRWSFD